MVYFLMHKCAIKIKLLFFLYFIYILYFLGTILGTTF
nr:MAG TPA: hypothetical protein [Caudoviricetes sp.]